VATTASFGFLTPPRLGGLANCLRPAHAFSVMAGTSILGRLGLSARFCRAAATRTRSISWAGANTLITSGTGQTSRI